MLSVQVAIFWVHAELRKNKNFLKLKSRFYYTFFLVRPFQQEALTNRIFSPGNSSERKTKKSTFRDTFI